MIVGLDWGFLSFMSEGLIDLLIERGGMVVDGGGVVMGVVSCAFGGDVGEVEETAEEHLFGFHGCWLGEGKSIFLFTILFIYLFLTFIDIFILLISKC